VKKHLKIAAAAVAAATVLGAGSLMADPVTRS
jgi:hypothetical protein